MNYKRKFVYKREICKQHNSIFSIYNNKNLVWHTHNFLLPYITVKECFIINNTFVFNLYFLCFAVDELPAFIIINYF